MPQKEVLIDDVKVGMYLTDIDISWMKSPFFHHRFMISTKQQIDSLEKAGVKKITIDTDKSISRHPEDSSTPPQDTPRKVLKPSPFAKEVEAAKNIKNKAGKFLNKTIESMVSGDGKIDTAELVSLVNNSSESLMRNAHALLSLFHIGDNMTELTSHCFSVMSLALILGQRMDLSDKELEDLGTAALLMDAGWSKLPNQLFTLPSEYSDDEYEQIQEHIDHSVKLLDDAGFNYDVTGLVVKHHERFDGSGYYSNYAGNEIPLMSQILSLADHYNSLIKGYYGTTSIIPAHALKQIYLKAKQGSHDIGLVELLIQVVGVYPLTSAVLLNTKEKAVVTKVNWRDGMSPTVRIFYDKNGVNRMKPVDVDLYNIKKQDNPRKILKIIDANIGQNDPANLLIYSV